SHLDHRSFATRRSSDLVICFRKDEQRFLTVQFKSVKQCYKVFSSRRIKAKIFHYFDAVIFHFLGKNRFLGKSLKCFVQFESVVSWFWAKNSTSTSESWGFNITISCRTGTFLLFKFSCRSCNLASFLGLMSSLSLCSKILLHFQVNRVLIRLNTKYSFVQGYLSSGFLTGVV